MAEPKSILEGITEHDVVEVFNPLSEEFIGKAATTIPVPRPKAVIESGNSEADAYAKGLSDGAARNGHQSVSHVQQQVPIPAGQSLRMPGDVARVVVRQLVKEIMQHDNKRRQMSDPVAFMEYERKVVKNHESMLRAVSLESAEERFKRQLAELNRTDDVSAKETLNEQAFPGESDKAGAGGSPKATGTGKA